MAIISIILFIICPLLSVPFLIYGFLNDTKHRYLYCIIFSVILSIVSYHFVPSIREDLFRHQHDVINYTNMTLGSFVDSLFNSTEQLSLILKYIVSLFKNVNLLQFFVTLFTYLILFFIIVDSSNKYNVSKLHLLLITFFTVFSINYMTIISNLFSMLATCVFSLGVYLEYEKESKKLLPYLLYISSVFVHSSLVLPIVIMLLFKLFKEKLNLKSIICLVLIIMAISKVVPFLATLNIPLTKELWGFYYSYFINNSNFEYLHTTRIIVLYFFKTIPFVFCYLFVPKLQKTKIDDFSFFAFIFIVLLFIQTTFAIRFIPLIQLCGIPLLIRYLKNSKNSIFLFLIVFAILIPEGVYQFHQLSQKEFGDILYTLTKNIFAIFRIN